MKQTPETVVLLNFVCDGIQKIARAIRDRHIYTMVMPYTVSTERLMQEKPVGLIFCSDAGVPSHEEEEKRFLALGLPVFRLTVEKNGDPAALVEKAVEFCKKTCGCTGSWTMENFIEEAVRDIREQVGDKKVILGLSGGVDSSVVAALIHKAVGKQLTCVFVNHGLLRKNEPEMVQEVFARNFDMNLCYIDASDRFLDKLEGVSDPEQKRKIIGKEFIDVFAEAAAKIDAPFLGQGTIYPDILESIPLDGNPAGVIKSHHNVGGLPKDLKFKLVEPVERLFKDEVRVVGRMLGLPSELIDRHPFPGPGLGVRILGEVKREYADLLREADAIFIEELRRAGWYDKVSQAFVVFLPVKSVGVMGDGRTYDWVVSLRSVETSDFMTAKWSELPYSLLATVSNRIINEVKGINRVVYDVSGKPPATIEWE